MIISGKRIKMNHEILKLMLLLIVIIPVTIIDIKNFRIPRIIVYPAMLIAFILNIFLYKQPVANEIIAVALGFLPFYVIRIATKGKMGFGDVYFSAFLALLLGIERWFLMVFISSSLAIMFAIISIYAGKMDINAKIPFAPFLSFGALLSFYIPL